MISYKRRMHSFLARRLSTAGQDFALAATAAAVVFAVAVWQDSPALPTALLSIGVAAPLALRRRWPLPVAIISSVVVLCGASAPGWPGELVAMAAFCSAAYHHSRRVAPVFAVSVAWLLVHTTVLPVARPGPGLLTEAVIMGTAPVAVGYAMRLHRERAEQAVRLHQAEAQRVVAEERSRLAREVHDAVGHHLTAIRMQASAATYALGELPPAASAAFGTVDELAGTALGEVRALLEALREDDLAGAASLSGVPSLAARMSTSDCPISVTWRGPAIALPPLVEHAGYRLVQEALTNAVRHAGASEISVTVRFRPDALVIAVDDDGPSIPASDLVAEGHGIRGMRERAQVLGGTLLITSGQPHGWSVRATLPIGRAT